MRNIPVKAGLAHLELPCWLCEMAPAVCQNKEGQLFP